MAKMILMTSLFLPDDQAQIRNQKCAVSSWLKAGFRVISLNSSGETKSLITAFPEVEFITARRTAIQEFGKPYVYITDLMEAARSRVNGVFGIINSDIVLRGVNEQMISDIERYASENLLVLHRYDIDKADEEYGEYFYAGLDVFFLHTSHIKCYEDARFVMGRPVWDWWMVYSSIKGGIDALEIKNPVAYHLKHNQRWSPEESTRLSDFGKGNMEEFFDIACAQFSDLSKSIVLGGISNAGNVNLKLFDEEFVDENATAVIDDKKGFDEVPISVGLGYIHCGKKYRVCQIKNKNYGVLAKYVDFAKTYVFTRIKDKRFYVYPYGRAGRMLLDCVKASGLSPVGVGDKDPALHGKYTKGYKISPPAEMVDCDYVLITSNLYANEVCTELLALGIEKDKLIVI